MPAGDWFGKSGNVQSVLESGDWPGFRTAETFSAAYWQGVHYGHSMKPATIPQRKTLQLDAQLRSDIALRKILLLELEIMEFNEACLLSRHDIECLHDFRVSLRHSRALLSGFDGVFPARDRQRFRASLAYLCELTGPCRDLDVFLQHWNECTDESNAAIRLIHDFLQQSRTAARERIVEALQGKKYLQFRERWREYMTAEPVTVRLRQANRPVSVLAMEHIDSVLRKIVKKTASITADSRDRKIHKLRIACKRLRYLLDYFHVFSANDGYAKLIPEMKKMQDKLGAYHDLVVQCAVIISVRQQMVAAGSMDDDVHNALHVIADMLNERAVEQRRQVLKALKKFMRCNALASILRRS